MLVKQMRFETSDSLQIKIFNCFVVENVDRNKRIYGSKELSTRKDSFDRCYELRVRLRHQNEAWSKMQTFVRLGIWQP